MAASTHYYWDACIFIAFLNKNTEAYGPYIDHIGQFLEDCRKGDCQIYTSTITSAEITKKRLTSSVYGDFNEFLEDYAGAVVPIGADPNVMALAGEIKGQTYTKTGGNREVGTADAIHLASALTLVSDYCVQLTAFHTFDDGGSKAIEGGKQVPILSFESWCEDCRLNPVIARIVGMCRKKPDHPDPKLPMILPVLMSKPAQMIAGPEKPAEPIPGRGKGEVPPAAPAENAETHGQRLPMAAAEDTAPAPLPAVPDATPAKPPFA